MAVFPFHKSLKAFCALNIFQKKVLFVNGLELVETWVQHTMDRLGITQHTFKQTWQNTQREILNISTNHSHEASRIVPRFMIHLCFVRDYSKWYPLQA